MEPTLSLVVSPFRTTFCIFIDNFQLIDTAEKAAILPGDRAPFFCAILTKSLLSLVVSLFCISLCIFIDNFQLINGVEIAFTLPDHRIPDTNICRCSLWCRLHFE